MSKLASVLGRVPAGHRVFIAREEQGSDLSFMTTFHHTLKQDMPFLDYSWYVTAPETGVKFRVRNWMLHYMGKPLRFKMPMDCPVERTMFNRDEPMTTIDLDKLGYAVIATANRKYPFIICKEWILEEVSRKP